MKAIRDYVEKISEELCMAKDYAEKAAWYKAKNIPLRYARYKEMALNELSHADTLHSFVLEDVDELEKVYPHPPQEMIDEWERSHKVFLEKTAWIKQILAM